MAGAAKKVEPPALPQATVLYETSFQDQYSNVLRLFFNRLTASLNALLDPAAGGASLYLPYGAFSDSTDQFAALTTVAYPISFNTIDYSSFVTLVSGTRMKVVKAALYNLQFSIQFVNIDSQIHDVDVWIRKNGVDVASTSSRFSVPNRHGGVDGHLIAALNIPIQLAVDDYVELIWHTTSIDVSIQYLPAGVAPVRPATPSVIATLFFVSAV